MLIVPLRQPEVGQHRPKHVVVHYIVIKYTSCDTVVSDYIQFSNFHTHTTGMTHFLDKSEVGCASFTRKFLLQTAATMFICQPKLRSGSFTVCLQSEQRKGREGRQHALQYR